MGSYTVNMSDLSDSPQGPAPSNQPQSSGPSNGPMVVNMSDLQDGPPTSGQPSDSMSINDNDSLMKKAGKVVGGTLEGIGEGVFGTVAGASDIANKVASKVGLSDGQQGSISKGLHDLAGDNEQRSTAASIGYGGESLMEMMLGDEALKLIPLAKRLGIVSKAMATLEQSPKLMAALKTGANVMQNNKVLSSPIVQEAIKAAMMQGVQTTVKTGGDVGQGAEDAATAGAVGGALGVAGKAVAKAGKAAKTVLGLSQDAAHAPSADSVFTGIADNIKKQKDDIQAIFDQAKGAADTDLASGTDAANKTLQDSKAGAVTATQDARQKIADNFKIRTATVQDATQKANELAKNNLVSGLDKIAGQEPDDVQALAKQVDEGINEYEKGTHTAYEKGLNGENGIISRMDGQTLEVKQSEASKAAKSALNVPDKNDHFFVAGTKKLAGEKLDGETKNLLQAIADGEVKVKGDDGTEVVKQINDLTPAQVIDWRQATRKAMAQEPRGSAVRNALKQVLDGIDKDIDNMAENAAHNQPEDAAGQSDIGADYKKLKATYREQRSYLDSDTAEKLRLHSPDDAMSNVNEYLLQGKNGPAKIGTIRKLIGDDGMQKLANAQIGMLKQLAEEDPQKFLREYGKINKLSATSLFGAETTAKLDSLANTYGQSVEQIDSLAKSTMSQAKAETKGLNESRKTLYGNTGPGEKQLGGLVGEGIKGAHAATLEQLQSKYDSAIDTAKAVMDKDSAKFTPTFVKRVSDGSIHDALLKGQVDPSDIRNLREALGESKWEDVSNGIFQRAVSDSSPKGNFDPDKMMDWWTGISPTVRAEMFVHPSSAQMFRASQVMNEVKDAAQVKKFVKWIGYPTMVGGGAAVGGFAGEMVGAKVLGGFGKFIGAMSGTTGGMTAAKRFVEWIANHPNTWKAFKVASQATDVAGSTALGQAARKVAPYAAGNSTMRNVFKGLQGSL